MDQFFGPPGLTKAQVLEKIRNSKGSQWICYPQERTLAFKGDLLIRMAATGHPRGAFTVLYGAIPVCEVTAAAEFSDSYATTLSMIEFTGGMNLKLENVEVIYTQPDQNYWQPATMAAGEKMQSHAAMYAE